MRMRHRSCPLPASMRAIGPWDNTRTKDSSPRDAIIACRTSAVLIPTKRNTRKALDTIATRLVRKRRPAPPMISRFKRLPSPKPIVHSGGIRATAIATPGKAVAAILCSTTNHHRTGKARKQRDS